MFVTLIKYKKKTQSIECWQISMSQKLPLLMFLFPYISSTDYKIRIENVGIHYILKFLKYLFNIFIKDG